MEYKTTEQIIERLKILDYKKVEEFLKEGITIEQILDLDLAIDVQMPKIEYRLINN